MRFVYIIGPPCILDSLFLRKVALIQKYSKNEELGPSAHVKHDYEQPCADGFDMLG